MTATAHTEGPWKAQRDIRHWSNAGPLTDDSPKAWAVYGPYRVCAIESSIVVPWDKDTEAEANAHLIANAPATAAAARAMLLALREARDYLGDEHTDDSDEARSARETVDSALCLAAAAGLGEG